MLIAFDIDTYVCFRVELNGLIVLNTWTCNRCLCSFRLQCCWCPLGLLIVNYWYPQSLIATYDSHSKQGCDFCCWSDAPAAIVHMTDVDLTRALITIAKHFRADSGFAPSQWETSLQSNTVSHCLGANLESVLHLMKPHKLHVTRWVGGKHGRRVVWGQGACDMCKEQVHTYHRDYMYKYIMCFLN